MVRQLGAGDVVVLGLDRQGAAAPVQVSVKSVPFPREVLDNLLNSELGVKLQPLDAKLAQQYQLYTQQGLVVTEVKKGGAAAQLGLQPGDVLRKINGSPTNTQEDLEVGLMKCYARRTALLQIQRGRLAYSVPVKF
jgi:serine protease Do